MITIIHSRCYFAVFPTLVLLIQPATSYSLPPTPQGIPDEKVLRYAHVPTDTAGLLAFVQEYGGKPVEMRQAQRLIRQLGSDGFQVRQKASGELISFGPGVLNLLRKAQDDQDPEVANRAAECVRRIKRNKELIPRAVRILVRRQSLEVIEALLRSKAVEVRIQCAQTVEELGPKATAVTPALLERLDDPEEQVRREVISALVQVLSPAYLPTVLRVAKDKRPRVRCSGTYLLWKFSDQPKQVVPVLLRALRDENNLVRREAAAGLWRFGSEKGVVPALIKALQDKDAAKDWSELNVAQTAANSLGVLRPCATTAVPSLIKAANGGDEMLRRCTISALGEISARDDTAAATVVPVLIKVFKNNQESIGNRSCAAYLLGRIGPQAKVAVPLLLKALKANNTPDAHWANGNRGEILTALAQFGPVAKEAVPDLILILIDQSLYYQERQRAAEALGSIGPAAKSAIPALTKGLKDKDHQVREAAAQALEKIKR